MSSQPKYADGLSSPAQLVFPITPGTGALPYVAKAIRAGAEGTITLRSVGQDVDVVHPVFAGELIPVRVTHVTACVPTGMTIIGYA